MRRWLRNRRRLKKVLCYFLELLFLDQAKVVSFEIFSMCPHFQVISLFLLFLLGVNKALREAKLLWRIFKWSVKSTKISSNRSSPMIRLTSYLNPQLPYEAAVMKWDIRVI